MLKPPAHEVSDVRPRNLLPLGFLLVITLGLYWFYLGYQWSKEINGLVGRVKYPPVALLVINIVTLGLAGLVFECIWAYDVAWAAEKRGMAWRAENLPLWIIVLNTVGLLLSLTGVGMIVGIPLGVAATIMIQMELNKLAVAVPALKDGELLKPAA